MRDEACANCDARTGETRRLELDSEEGVLDVVLCDVCADAFAETSWIELSPTAPDTP